MPGTTETPGTPGATPPGSYGTPVLTYEVHGSHGDYTEEWYCQPPAPGIVYRVTDCTWTPGYTVRRIFAVSVGQGREALNVSDGKPTTVTPGSAMELDERKPNG